MFGRKNYIELKIIYEIKYLVWVMDFFFYIRILLYLTWPYLEKFSGSIELTLRVRVILSPLDR